MVVETRELYVSNFQRDGVEELYLLIFCDSLLALLLNLFLLFLCVLIINGTV